MSHGSRLFKVALLSASMVLVACSGDSAESLISSAKQHLEKHDSKAATIQLKNALQKEPKSGEARYLLGKLMLDSGDAVGASVELGKAQELAYDPDKVIPALASAQLRQGRLDKALAYRTTALQTPAAQAELQSVLASVYLAQSKRPEAMEAIEAALRADPANLRAQLLRVRALASAKDFTAANAQLSKVMAASPQNAEAWQIKGDIQMAAGEKDAALASYREALQRDKASLLAHNAAIWILLSKNDLAGAETQLQAMRSAFPQHPQTKFFTAVIAMEKGDTKSAFEQAQQLLKQNPDNTSALQLAGTIDMRRGSLVQAEANLSKALKLAPDLSRVRLLLAQTHLRSGDAAKAIKVLQALINPDEPVWEPYALMGQALLLQGESAKASTYFAQAAKLNPKDSRSRSALALEQIAKGHAEQGYEDLRSISATDPGPTADLVLVSAHMRNKDFDRALKAVDQLESKQPKSPLAANLRGQIELARTGHMAQARSAFESALKIDPKFFPAAASLALLDVADGKPDLARQRFEKLLQAEPKNVRASMALIALQAQAGASKEALIEQLVKTIQANPEEAAPRLALVRLQMERKDYKQALTAAQDGAAVLPDNPEMLDALGAVLAASGDSNQAIAIYNKIAVQQPNSPQPFMRLAEIYAAKKDMPGASQNFKRALAIKPDLVPAQRSLMLIEMMAGRNKEALAIARSVQAQRSTDPIGFTLEGDLESSQKNWPAATAAYRAGLAKKPTSELTIKLHQVLIAAGKTDEARKVEQDWLKAHGEDAAFLYYLGDTALNRSDTEVAEKRYEAVIKLQPDNAMALNNLAWLQNRAKKPGALDYALRAVKLAPKEPAFLDTLAEVYGGSGQWPKAIETQKAAIAASANSPDLKLNLARLYVSAGEKSLAKQELTQLSELGAKFPRQTEVKAILEKL